MFNSKLSPLRFQLFIVTWQLIIWIGGWADLLQLSFYDLALRNMVDEI